jgi:hypothetical protein
MKKKYSIFKLIADDIGKIHLFPDDILPDAAEHNRSSIDKLAIWSPELLKGLGVN